VGTLERWLARPHDHADRLGHRDVQPGQAELLFDEGGQLGSRHDGRLDSSFRRSGVGKAGGLEQARVAVELRRQLSNRLSYVARESVTHRSPRECWTAAVVDRVLRACRDFLRTGATLRLGVDNCFPRERLSTR
jgi:hypothetical protein